MQYLLGLMCVVAALAALPKSANAQDGEEGATSEPKLQGSAPLSEPAFEEAALQFQLDSAGVVFTLIPGDEYTFEEMELRLKRAKIGLGVSAVSTAVGIALSVAAGTQRLFCFEPCSYPGWVDPVFAIGLTLAVGGLAGMIASGILLRRRKRDLREARYGRPPRVQWNLARSRLVF